MRTAFLFCCMVLLLTSCDWFGSDKKSNDSSSIGGSTNIVINTVGNTFANLVAVGGVAYSGSIFIISVTDGVATVKFISKLLASIPLLAQIKSKYKDASGNLVCEGKFKMTDEGILDYNNKDHKTFVLVKYNAEVGDKYTLDKSDGTTITREVVRKSSTDDFYWSGMIIKTVDVEQSSSIPGIKKVIYFTNRKFGLVAVRLEMEDGTKPQLNLVPNNY